MIIFSFFLFLLCPIFLFCFLSILIIIKFIYFVKQLNINGEKIPDLVKEEKTKVKRTRKAKIKTSIVVQAYDREVSMEEAIERATEDWCKSGNDRADLKEIAVYVKPEEAGIFYVINGKATGRVAF